MMSRLISIVLVGILLTACKENPTDKTVSSKESKEIAQNEYTTYGAPFEAEELKTMNELSDLYKNLQKGDTTQVKFKATVNEVCQKKGCWITVGQDSLMVRFKDYAFFMPKDIAGDEAIINGMAYWEETDVETLRHYAEDAGKSPEEIAAITSPKMEQKFLAEGVLLNQ